jgi:hypothetical protein
MQLASDGPLFVRRIHVSDVHVVHVPFRRLLVRVFDLVLVLSVCSFFHNIIYTRKTSLAVHVFLFSKYAQDCNMGYAAVLTIISIICYMLAQSLVCCTPRPTPLFNCCKKAPVRRKKKKKKKKHDDDEESPEGAGLTRDYDYEDDGFEDEPDQGGYYDDGDGYVDPYAEEDEFTNFEDQSSRNLQETSESDEPDETEDSEDIYSTNNTYQDYDNDTYAQEDDSYDQEGDTYDRGSSDPSAYTDDDGGTSYYTEDDETNYTSQSTENDYTDSGGNTGPSGGNSHEENESGWSTGEDNSQIT